MRSEKLPNYYCDPEHYPKSIEKLILATNATRKQSNTKDYKIKFYNRRRKSFYNDRRMHYYTVAIDTTTTDKNDDDDDDDDAIVDTTQKEINSIRSEFERLKYENYTHTVNMPGNINDIIAMARTYNIIPLDCRLQKYIADYCVLTTKK